MKKLYRTAWVSILLILVIMTLLLSEVQTEEELHTQVDGIEYFFNDEWTVFALEDSAQQIPEQQERIRLMLEAGAGQQTDLPYSGKSSPGETIVFRNSLPPEYAGLVLKFSSSCEMIHIILDGEMIYQYGGEDHNVLRKKRQDQEHLVNIPTVFHKGELWIELTSADSDAAAALSGVNIVAADLMIVGMLESDFINIACCILMMIMAIVMLMLTLIRLYTRQPMCGELYLGLAGLDAGIFYLIKTDTLNICYGIMESYAIVDYLGLLLLPVLLTLYFERNFHTVYPRRFTLLLWCVNVHTVGQLVLQMLNVRKLEEMGLATVLVVVAVCILAIVSLIQYDVKTKSHQALFTAVSMCVLLGGGLASIALHIYHDSGHVYMVSQYTTTIFSVMMAMLHTLRLSKEYRARAEESARLLKEKVKAAEVQNTQLMLAKQDADAARHEALAANEAKGKFLAHMSHEIRTPINAVLGMDEMILRESREQNIKDYAMDIYTAGQTLLSLINDILDFSKIESGKMEIVPVEYDVSSMIHDLANMTTQRAKDKHIHLEVEADHAIPSRLYGDDVRIRQVLTNILTNAVKYTPEGTVWFRIRSHNTPQTAVLHFEVEDTGIGIKAEDLPKLSAEFERIEEERNRNIEGSGLGMNITQQLLALLGSKLKVESVYGKGSKFFFELEQKVMDATPIGDFEERVHQLAETYSYDSRFCAPKARFLVVDDNAVNRKVFRNLLKQIQPQVTEAEGGKECLRLVQENHYDLIFLDHMMPEMDGIETLHHMKALREFPCQNTPVIVLTANAVSGAKEKYLAEGFDDFLSKPIVPKKLEQMIQRMLPGELIEEAMDPAAMETDASSLNGSKGTDRHFASEQQTQTLSREESEEKLEQLPSVDGLDWNYAWLHLSDWELLEYSVKEFYQQIPSAAERLDQYYQRITEAEQLDLYRIQVHAMKSLAATIGIIPLAGLAKILEFAAKDGRIELIQSMTQPFLEEWRSYQQKLCGVFGIEEAERKEVTDFSVIQALVEMVRLSMQEMDIDQADELIGQLRSYEYAQELEQMISALADAVNNLDPEEADRLADLLLEQIKR